MQALAEFMAESYRSKVLLTWDLDGLSLARASFAVDSISVSVSFERRQKKWAVARRPVPGISGAPGAPKSPAQLK